MRFKLTQKIIDKIRHKDKSIKIFENFSVLLNKLEQNNILLQQILNSLNKDPRKQIVGGQKWDLELEERYKNKLYLDSFGYKVFSQNDEDGIINEIFNRIGTTNKMFIEFGVQDGMECNSHLLLLTGWKGLWIDGNKNDCEKINKTFKTSILNNNLRIENAFITKDNINNIIKRNNIIGDIDFLSVDIDGNDYHILQSILDEKLINPRVICIEYNPLIPPSNNPDDTSTDWIMEYKEDWVWKVDDCQGASLSAYYHLLKKYNYSLVGTGITGVNAFFVRKDLIQDKFISDKNGALTFYNPWRHKSLRYLKPFADGFCALNESMDNRLEIYKEIFK